MADQPKTILFVEDDQVVVLAYGNSLRRAGYEVATAGDGLEAMRFLHGVAPDLIVLDLMMPRFNGVEVLKFIRSNPRLKKLPVIIFSTNSIIDASHDLLLEAASRRLIKGVCTATMLLEAVQELLPAPHAGITAHPPDELLHRLAPGLEAAAA